MKIELDSLNIGKRKLFEVSVMLLNASLSWRVTVQNLETSSSIEPSIKIVQTHEEDDILGDCTPTWLKYFDGEKDIQSLIKTQEEDGIGSASLVDLQMNSRVSKMLFVGTIGTSNSNFKEQPKSIACTQSQELEVAGANLDTPATIDASLSGYTTEEETSKKVKRTITVSPSRSQTRGLNNIVFKFFRFWKCW